MAFGCCSYFWLSDWHRYVFCYFLSTYPHGPVSVTAAVFATFGFIFTLAAFSSCEYMTASFDYCVPPKPLFGSCGDCHCIVAENKTCPTGDDVPRTNFSQETVDQWKALKLMNPMTLDCNPYQNRTCATQPPQEYLELWEDAVCGIKYNTDTLDPDTQCPTEYETVSYPSLAALQNDTGAELTHYGSCGVCSSLQDLAVYVESPDLTAKGQECGVIGLADLNAAIKCFEDAGYTTVRRVLRVCTHINFCVRLRSTQLAGLLSFLFPIFYCIVILSYQPCAIMWVYNTIQTRGTIRPFAAARLVRCIFMPIPDIPTRTHPFILTTTAATNIRFVLRRLHRFHFREQA